MTPYESVWRAPGVAARWKGVVVYHTYKDDDMGANPPEWFWFTTDREGDSEDEHAFDVRELPTWVEPEHPPYLSPPEIKDKANWRVEYRRVAGEVRHPGEPEGVGGLPREDPAGGDPPGDPGRDRAGDHHAEGGPAAAEADRPPAPGPAAPRRGAGPMNSRARARPRGGHHPVGVCGSCGKQVVRRWVDSDWKHTAILTYGKNRVRCGGTVIPLEKGAPDR